MSEENVKNKTYTININGKEVPFDKLPCAKCEWRYSFFCPRCEWNKKGEYNTY